MKCRYRIRCRQIVKLDDHPHMTEMRLQLYKVQEHAYLLDFQKLDGNVWSGDRSAPEGAFKERANGDFPYQLICLCKQVE